MDCSTPGLPVHHQLLEFTPNSCPLSWWCHPTISSSVVPLSSCLQSFLASGSFLMSRLFASGSQSIGASASVLPMNIQDCFPLGLPGLTSFQFRQEYSSGLSCPAPGDLPNPGIEPRSPALQADSLPAEPHGKIQNVGRSQTNKFNKSRVMINVSWAVFD